MSDIKQKTFLMAVGLIVIAAASRFIPHPFNFTAVGAMALFAGANFSDKKYAYLIPLAAMFITDLFFGFHSAIAGVYISFGLIVLLGTFIRKNQSILSVAGSSLISSLLFFAITNLPIWYGGAYAYNLNGTLQSYTMALPFFGNQIAGDLFYNTLIFSVYHAYSNQLKKATA